MYKSSAKGLADASKPATIASAPAPPTPLALMARRPHGQCRTEGALPEYGWITAHHAVEGHRCSWAEGDRRRTRQPPLEPELHAVCISQGGAWASAKHTRRGWQRACVFVFASLVHLPVPSVAPATYVSYCASEGETLRGDCQHGDGFSLPYGSQACGEVRKGTVPCVSDHRRRWRSESLRQLSNMVGCASSTCGEAHRAVRGHIRARQRSPTVADCTRRTCSGPGRSFCTETRPRRAPVCTSTRRIAPTCQWTTY